MIKVNLEDAINKSKLTKYNDRVKEIHKMIHEKTGQGNDFLGWVDYPNSFDKDEYKKMKKVASNLQSKIDYLVVIGIGGSYLGSRAAIEMINGIYPKNQKVKVLYAGHTMSSTYTKQLLEFLNDKKFGICVISKSGTTTEPAIAFRLFKQLLIKKHGFENTRDYIVCVTDGSKGDLRKQAIENKYEVFGMPDDIGGRFSVLTPVGIFPMMVAGINTDDVFKGAKKAYSDLKKENNSAYEYALARYVLHKDEKFTVELLVSYELQMQYFNEWWKQLFGESEGKENKALFPASCLFSTDLHSLGQFIQEGSKILFETVIKFKKIKHDIKMFKDKDDLDKLNYLQKRTLNEINYIAQKGVIDAHKNTGNVPNIILELESLDAKTFGYLAYWFFKACAMSAYLLEVNPFNQPGVEVYKANMFQLLGKK